MFGYSTGAVIKAGHGRELKPQIIDLLLIIVIWAIAIYSALALNMNRWLLVLIWLILSVFIGILSIWPRKLPVIKPLGSQVHKDTSRNILTKAWRGWGNFSKQMGGFQSRLILSFLYFILASLLALFLKIFADPLNIKGSIKDSYWLPKEKGENDLEQFRRQG
jgi:hypothetical protein